MHHWHHCLNRVLLRTCLLSPQHGSPVQLPASAAMVLPSITCQAMFVSMSSCKEKYSTPSTTQQLAVLQVVGTAVSNSTHAACGHHTDGTVWCPQAQSLRCSPVHIPCSSCSQKECHHLARARNGLAQRMPVPSNNICMSHSPALPA
jgi:hypothetical protein